MRVARIVGFAAMSLLALIAPSFGSPNVGKTMDDYSLEAGDILELSSITIPELRNRFQIQMDGGIAVPLIGRVEAAGLTLGQVQENLRVAFAAKVLRQRGSDGRESLFLIQPYDIVAAVAQFRPVYVSGDVSKPGEQSYRPNMTVRQAIAMSGGLDVGRYRATHPVVEAAELKGAYEADWIDFTRRRVLIWRLKRELGGSDVLDESELAGTPVDTDLIRRLLQTERSQLDMRNRDHQLEREYFGTLVRQADQQITILTEQRDKEEQGREADADELKRSQDLFGKGTLTSQRVTEARRAVLLSSTRKLQTDAQVAQLQKQRSDAASNLERIDGLRKIRVNQELLEAEAAMAVARSRLQATGEKIHYVGLLRSSLQNTDGGGPIIHVVRRTLRSSAPEDFVLMPGDVVEVEIRAPLDRARSAAVN